MEAGEAEENDAPEPPKPICTVHYSDEELLSAVTRLVVYAARRIATTTESELASIQTILESFVPEMVGVAPETPCPPEVFASQSKEDGAAAENGAMDVAAAPNGAASNRTVFYANRHWFVLFRLHQIVYERLRDIKAVSVDISKKHAARAESDATSVAETLSLRGTPEYPPDGYFDSFLTTTEKLIDGRIDLPAYEETMLEMFSIVAYKTFTMDRLLTTCARKLDTLVKDDMSRSLAGLYVALSRSLGPFAPDPKSSVCALRWPCADLFIVSNSYLRSKSSSHREYREQAFDILGEQPAAESHFFRLEHLGKQVSGRVWHCDERRAGLDQIAPYLCPRCLRWSCSTLSWRRRSRPRSGSTTSTTNSPSRARATRLTRARARSFWTDRRRLRTLTP